MPRRLFAVLALAFASAGGPVVAADAPPVTIVKPEIGGVPWTPEEIAKLQSDIDALLVAAPTVRGAHLGVLAIDTKTGTPLYERNADDAFQPASTLKLLVGSAALEKLGPDFRFTTSAYLWAYHDPNPMPVDGRLQGWIVLRGGGDPFLTAQDLSDFAAAVLRHGVRKVESLAIDASRYDDRNYPDGWTWDDFAYDYAAPISAMSIDENVVHIRISPGDRVGGSANASASPVGIANFIVNSEPWSEGCPATLSPIIQGWATTLQPGAPSTLDVQRDDHNCITISGGIALDAAPESLDAAVPSGPAYAYELAYRALQAVKIDPGSFPSLSPKPWNYTTTVIMPPGAPVVWSRQSAPLKEWLGERFWIPSDNLVAELVLKELGFETSGAPGTSMKGIAFERSWLRSIGVDPATTTLADGSGMSQYDRITPRDLVAILQHDWNGPNRDLVLASLPVGGARGTIEGIAGTDAAGRVFAKTGSMMHIRGLAGYLATKRHGAVTFDFTVDDWLGDYADLAPLRAAVLSRIVDD